MTEEICLKCGKRATWIVLGINTGLFLIKFVFAFMSRSYSLFADSFESFANLIITVIVLISIKIAEKEYDDKHPYGYGKIEYLASGAINLILMLGSVFFIVISLKALIFYIPEEPPELIAIVAAVISIIANQIAFLYGRCVGGRLRSPAILANAAVNQVDVATSAAVIIAVTGSNLGMGFLDHLVAILIAVLIIKTTAEGLDKAVKGLMDHSYETDIVRMRNVISRVRGVLGVNDLKARQVGRKTWVDIEILVSEKSRLEEGLGIIKKLKKALHSKISNIADISVRLTPAEAVK